MEWVETINARKGVLGGETLKTLAGCSEEGTWNTQAIRKKISWGCIGLTGEEFGGSHDHYISMVLLRN